MIRKIGLLVLLLSVWQLTLADKTFDEAMPKAQAGDAQAQYVLGNTYIRGTGVKKNYEEALKWYTKAAEQGHAGAQNNLARMYTSDNHGLKDYKKAVKWYTKAAEQNYANAQFTLGTMYYNGEGVKQNFRKAYVWLSCAVTNGLPGATESRDAAASKLTPKELKKATREIEKQMKTKKADTPS